MSEDMDSVVFGATVDGHGNFRTSTRVRRLLDVEEGDTVQLRLVNRIPEVVGDV